VRVPVCEFVCMCVCVCACVCLYECMSVSVWVGWFGVGVCVCVRERGGWEREILLSSTHIQCYETESANRPLAWILIRKMSTKCFMTLSVLLYIKYGCLLTCFKYMNALCKYVTKEGITFPCKWISIHII